MEIFILGLLVMAFIACLALAFPAAALITTYYAITTGSAEMIFAAIGTWFLTFLVAGFVMEEVG